MTAAMAASAALAVLGEQLLQIGVFLDLLVLRALSVSSISSTSSISNCKGRGTLKDLGLMLAAFLCCLSLQLVLLKHYRGTVEKALLQRAVHPHLLCTRP